MPIEAGQELAASQTVFRLVRRIPKFVPSGRPGINGETFRPSTGDESEALERGQPVRVSVWESSMATVAGGASVSPRWR
jgi:hypothetical protein